MAASALFVVLALALHTSASICTFYPNGFSEGRHLSVDLADKGNAARLNSSLLFVANQLGLISNNLPVEFDVYTLTGQLVTDVQACNSAPEKKLFLVRHGDLWIYPPVVENYERDIALRDRHVKMRTLSKRPRSFEVENFLTPEECAELKKLSQLSTSGVLFRLERKATLSAADFDVVSDIEDRLADLLRIPSAVVSMNDGLELRLTRKQASSDGPCIPERDFIHKGDEPAFEPLRQGVNRFVTIFFFLNEVREGGEVNLPFARLTNPESYIDESSSGKMKFLLPSSVMACNSGAFSKPRQGTIVVLYDIDANLQGSGEPDILALYQLCNPVSGDRWWARMRIFNKIMYDLTSLPALKWIDNVLASVIGVSVTQILTNGYGWDYTEDVLGDSAALKQFTAEEITKPLPGFFDPK